MYRLVKGSKDKHIGSYTSPLEVKFIYGSGTDQTAAALTSAVKCFVDIFMIMH